MSLDRYKQKRDFSKTSEPSGDKEKSSSQPIFVIQKHNASNLHYDLRLEIGGVLKSWAVPKKPPEKSGIKRLAIQTEDHPLEYGDFEGEIPKGQYGAGKVKIWDQGKYENLRKEKENMSMDKSWQDGKIEIKLKGEKLKGKYALINTSQKEEHWLLLKMKS